MSSPPLLVQDEPSQGDHLSDSHTLNGFTKTLQVPTDISDDDYSLPSVEEKTLSNNMNCTTDDTSQGTSNIASSENQRLILEHEKVKVLTAREEMLFWIKSIKEVGRCAGSSSLSTYKFQLPDLSELIKQWPAEHQKLFRTLPMKWPTEDPDCSLEQHVDLCIALLKIPNEKAQFQAMQLLFSLYVELTKSLHYQSACHDTLLQLMSDLTRKYRTK